MQYCKWNSTCWVDTKLVLFLLYFEKNKRKSSEICKVINSLVNIKSSKTSIRKLLDENNNLVSDPRKISHKFNHYFLTIGPDIERMIPIVSGSFKDYFNKKGVNGKLLTNPFNSSFFLSPTVPGEVERIIDDLDIKKSNGQIVFLFSF